MSTNDFIFLVKWDFYVFAESTTVVISGCLGITYSLKQILYQYLKYNYIIQFNMTQFWSDFMYLYRTTGHTNIQRKFEQWWSIIPLISTKWTITSHLRSLNTRVRVMVFDVTFNNISVPGDHKNYKFVYRWQNHWLSIMYMYLNKKNQASVISYHRIRQV